MNILVRTSLIPYASIFINELVKVEFLGQKVYALKIVISTATLTSMKVMPNLLLLTVSERVCFPLLYPVPNRVAF